MIVLVLGGARSGKSVVAEHRSADLAGADGAVTVIATAVVTDDDMAARVAEHRARRPPAWATFEAGARLAGALIAVRGVALVDSLGTWVAGAPDMRVDIDELCNAVTGRGDDTVVVSEEVGMGVHRSSEAGRRFRDALGSVNQAVAAIADEVLLVVAGRTLALDGGGGGGAR